MNTLKTILRAAAGAALTLTIATLATSNASADPGRGRGHGCYRRHGHAVRYVDARFVTPCVPRVHVAVAPIVVRPVYRPVVRTVYTPIYAPAYAPAYVPAPYAYGTVVYDRGRDGVDGFVSISGPHVSVGIGF